MMISLGSSLGSAQAAVNQIKKVVVNIKVAGSPASSEVEKRISASVQKVSEKVLLKQEIDKVKKNQEYLEYTIQEVFNRVLSGYQVKKVSLQAGTTTTVTLELLPLGEQVENVELAIVTKNLSPPLVKLVEEKKPELEKIVNKALRGLPVDTMNWSQIALEPLLEKMVVKQLPGFNAGIDFQWGKDTKIVLSLQPQPPLIRRIEINIKSDTLPKILMQSWRAKAEEQAEIFEGLPVVFVQAHLSELEEVLQKELDKNPMIKKYGLVVTPEVRLGEITQVDMTVNSNKYVFDVSGTVYLGSKSPHETEIKGHLGIFIQPRQELFLEPVFYPNPVKLEWSGGYTYQFNEKNKIGYRHNFTEGDDHLYYDHSLDKGIIRLDRNFKNKVNELSYRQPLDEYFSVSLTCNSEGENWIALTGEL